MNQLQRPRPTLTQARHFIYVEVYMFGSAQHERILGVEDGPHSRWTMMTTTTPPCSHRPKAVGSEDNVLLQSMDESGRGPRIAVAEAVASPLEVQPSINSAGVSSSIGQPLGMMQL